MDEEKNARAEDIGISESSYRRLIALFVEETVRDLAALGKAMEEGNRMDARALFHHITGAAEGLCFDDISAAIKELRAHWEAGDTSKRDMDHHSHQVLVRSKSA